MKNSEKLLENLKQAQLEARKELEERFGSMDKKIEDLQKLLTSCVARITTLEETIE